MFPKFEIGHVVAAMPKVFLSHRPANTQDEVWGKTFAEQLRAHGVEALIDVVHAGPGTDLNHWQEQGIGASDFVLLICTPEYKTAFEDPEGPMGLEVSLIKQRFASQAAKVVPILRRGAPDEAIPKLFQDLQALDFVAEVTPIRPYHELLDALLGRDRTPPLGTPPPPKTFPGEGGFVLAEHLASSDAVADWTTIPSEGALTVEIDHTGEVPMRRYYDGEGLIYERRHIPRAELAKRLDTLRGVMRRGDPDELAEHLTGAQSLHHGETLFDVLFPQDMPSLRKVLRRAMFWGPRVDEPYPNSRPVRVRIRERPPNHEPPLLDDLPWRITTWSQLPLTQQSSPWRFEVAPWPGEPDDIILQVPCRVLVVAPESTGLSVDQDYRSIEHIMKRATDTLEQDDFEVNQILGRATTQAQVVSEVQRIAPDIVYYLGLGTSDGALQLQLDDHEGQPDRVSLSKFKTLLQGDIQHSPKVVYLGGHGTAQVDVHGAARQWLPEIPIVIGQPMDTLHSPNLDDGLRWLEEVLVQGKSPSDVLHERGLDTPREGVLPSDARRGFEWALPSLAVHASTVRVERRKTLWTVIGDNVDRVDPRALAADSVRELVTTEGRRVLALISYGTHRDGLSRLSNQLAHKVQVEWAGQLVFKQVQLKIDAQRMEPKRLKEQGRTFKALMEAELRRGLKDSTRRPLHDVLDAALLEDEDLVGAHRILWLNFGVYGSTKGHHAPLTYAQVKAWWRYLCHDLPPACPPGLRIVTVLVLEPSAPDKLSAKLDQYAADPSLHSSAFRHRVLRLTYPSASELIDLMTKAGCTEAQVHRLAVAVLKAAAGDYEKVVALLKTGEKRGWVHLAEELGLVEPEEDEDEHV